MQLASENHWRVCLPQARKVETKQVDFNATFIARMIPKLDWGVLKAAAETVRQYCTHTPTVVYCYQHHAAGIEHQSFLSPPQLGHGGGLPDSLPDEYESQEDFLKAAHHVLLEVGVVSFVSLMYCCWCMYA